LIPVIIPIGYIFAYRKGEDKDYFERIGFIKIDKDINNSIWIHCASVGEVRSIKTLFSHLREEFPNVSLVVSTTTATGKKTALEELKPDVAFLLPIENRWAISYLIDILKCKLFLIVDTEIWPNLINVASKKVPLFLINGRLSEKSFRKYKLFRSIFKPILNRFTLIFTKSEEDSDRFREILGDSNKITTMGNIKFLNFSDPEDLKIIPANKRLFIAASTHEGEEEIVIDAFLDTIDLDLFDQIVIAPRHLNRIDDIKNICLKKGLKICTISNYNPDADAIIVDRFGCLEYLYRLGIKIFVGGSLVNIGGHNIFEALRFKKVIAVGPYMQNFEEIFRIALKYKLVKVVMSKDELLDYFKTDYRNVQFNMFIEEVYSSSKEKLKPLIGAIKGVLY
jgi:3-deoxy-D-manno-octulosonic-acid transferase